MPVNPTLQINKAVCATVAVAMTVSRLVIRRQRRYWFDDGWALFSLLSLILQMSVIFLDLHSLSRHSKVSRYYIMAICFYCIIWSARLSILCSVIRIHSSITVRRLLITLAGLFLLVWMTLVAQLLWVVICQLVSDIIADAILLISPVQLFTIIRDKGLRYRLMIIFSTCIVTTVVSLVHATYILVQSGKPSVVISALVEVVSPFCPSLSFILTNFNHSLQNSISLIVCNIPVVVGSLFRLADGSSRRKGQIKFASFLPSGLMAIMVSHKPSQDTSTAQSLSTTCKVPEESVDSSQAQKAQWSEENNMEGKAVHQMT
ncbi:hypothetical protein Hypma_008384 [Hypsizygus marmoreus]|uniref:Uncharacterized protein n=1 Tax=Hypsizygus marmoreus TaxID=39966 RepID=A0A369JXU3_HYPMA|nr:hypothetical protein Hypma_008384 [Hypsizygus marmoreus]